MALNVESSDSGHDVANVLGRNPVDGGSFGRSSSFTERGIKPPHFKNLSIRHYYVVVLISMAMTAASLFHAVPNVVQNRSREKVTWIDAWGVITMVQHLKPFRDFSFVDFKRNPMAHWCSTVLFDLTVSAAVDPSSPNPAFSEMRSVLWNGTILVNSGPKSFIERISEISGPNQTGFAKNLFQSHYSYNDYDLHTVNTIRYA